MSRQSLTIMIACSAAHAVFTDVRTVTPKSRDGMIESLRVLKVCRKTAISARRVALQLIHNTIVSAPDELPEALRAMTRMQLIRAGRLRTDSRTRAYVDKRVSEGHSKLETIRCLKRYIAREVYYVIRQRV